MFRAKTILILLTAAASALSQTPQTGEEAQVRRVVQAYVNGTDVEAQRRAFHSEARLLTQDDRGALRIIPVATYLDLVGKSLASGQPSPGRELVSLDIAGNAAMAKVSSLGPRGRVTDFLSLLKLEGEWKIVDKAFAIQPVAPGCSEFDFTLGDWRMADRQAADGSLNATGTAAVRKILDGCTLEERWHVEQNGKKLFDAVVLRAHDAASGLWTLTYVDDAHNSQVYQGKHEGGGWSFYRERLVEGQPAIVRIRWAAAADGYTQTIERSLDAGRTWTPRSVVRYSH